MGKKPSKDTHEKQEKEPWEREAEELGVTGEPDPWEAELPKVIGPAKPPSASTELLEPVPPVGSPASKLGLPTKSETPNVKSDSKAKAITKIPGPKRKFQ